MGYYHIELLLYFLGESMSTKECPWDFAIVLTFFMRMSELFTELDFSTHLY